MTKPAQHREYLQHAIEVLRYHAAHPWRNSVFEAEACAHAARELEDQLASQARAWAAMKAHCSLRGDGALPGTTPIGGGDCRGRRGMKIISDGQVIYDTLSPPDNGHRDPY